MMRAGLSLTRCAETGRCDFSWTCIETGPLRQTASSAKTNKQKSVAMNRVRKQSKGGIGAWASKAVCVFSIVIVVGLLGVVLSFAGAPAAQDPPDSKNLVAAPDPASSPSAVESAPTSEPQQVAPKNQPPAAAAQANKVPDVKIETRQGLDFGLLRVRQNSSGWVVVDPGGGFCASPSVAFSSRHMPASGQVTIKAAPESRILLRLTFDDGASEGSCISIGGVTLRSLRLGRGIQQLARNGEFWELIMPRADAETVEVMLQIGGELHFTSSDQGRSFKTELHIDCQ